MEALVAIGDMCSCRDGSSLVVGAGQEKRLKVRAGIVVSGRLDEHELGR